MRARLASGWQQVAAAPQARQRGRAAPAGLRRLRERSAALPARGTAPAALPGPVLPAHGAGLALAGLFCLGFSISPCLPFFSFPPLSPTYLG